MNVGLDTSMIDEFQCFVLSKITCKGVVIVILEYLSVKIISGWYLDSVIEKKEIRRVS